MLIKDSVMAMMNRRAWVLLGPSGSLASRTSSCEGDDRPGGFNMALASHLVWKLLGVMNTCRNPKAAITHRLYLPVRLNMQSKT